MSITKQVVKNAVKNSTKAKSDDGTTKVKKAVKPKVPKPVKVKEPETLYVSDMSLIKTGNPQIDKPVSDTEAVKTLTINETAPRSISFHDLMRKVSTMAIPFAGQKNKFIP